MATINATDSVKTVVLNSTNPITMETITPILEAIDTIIINGNNNGPLPIASVVFNSTTGKTTITFVNGNVVRVISNRTSSFVNRNIVYSEGTFFDDVETNFLILLFGVIDAFIPQGVTDFHVTYS